MSGMRVICKQVADTYTLRTVLSIETKENKTLIYWRTIPRKLGLDISMLKEYFITGSNLNKSVHIPMLDLEGSFVDLGLEDAPDGLLNRLELKFEITSERMYERVYEFVITLEFQNVDECRSAFQQVEIAVNDSQARSKHDVKRAASVLEFKIVSEQEKVFQFITSMNRREGAVLVEKNMYSKRRALLSMAIDTWSKYVAETNRTKMVADKSRWRLHAATNIDNDLQAWYHSAFSSEIYRLRGSFWYRDAALPSYKASYAQVDNNLTQLEEAALSHILCSPGTTYVDVAGQMFTVQAIVGQSLYTLFTNLSSNGALATKYPRSGRPSKKLFRFSFVEGSIYLTWKGKAGNTGVDLADVSHVTRGLCSEILKKKGTSSMADNYLSLFSTGRSVDLHFDTDTECFTWYSLLEALVKKEKMRMYELLGIEDPINSATSTEYDVLVYKSVVGIR